MRDFDYRQNGYYFVTVCTSDRRPHIAGPVLDIVSHEIDALATRFPGVTIDERVLMTNHVHVILVFAGASASLPAIVQAFKSRTTVRARVHGLTGKLWQRGYYERVIRDERELARIREYIRNNPLAERVEFLERQTGRASSAPTPADRGGRL